MLIAMIDNADLVAWICLGVGLVVLLAGVIIGLVLSLQKAPAQTRAALETASQKVDETRQHLATATAPGLEAGGQQASMSSAAASTDAAKSALDEVSGIVASLPEPLRFSGMLVLVGTVLMSVATIQFGGVSLF